MTRNVGTLDPVPPVALAGKPLARGDETRAGRLRAWTTSALRDLIPVQLVAYVTSAWILGRRVLGNRSTSPWVALLVGWGILRVLALVPVAGALVGLAATVVGLGALAVALWRTGRPGAPAARPDAPAPGRAAPAA